MAPAISFSGSNSGLQVGDNHGQITAQLYVSENVSADQACLWDLQTTNPRHDKHRIETANGGLLSDAYNWILNHADFKRWRYEQQSQLLWIKGDPGKGKTMLLCGIIDELTKSALDTTSISFFFCQATDARINHATAVLRGLIFMMIDQQPSLISHVRRQYDKTGKQVFEDVNAWTALSEILNSILKDPLLQTTYLIIDALDECTTGLDRLLELVAQKSSVYPRVKWIASSRNWPAIEETLIAATQKTTLSLEFNETSVAQAVAAFIHYKVELLTEKKKYNNETRHAVSQHLLSNAHGTFLWVALVCDKLANTPKRNVRKKLEEFPSGLNELYKRMLDQISNTDDAKLCKSLLSVITTVYRPITLDELVSSIDLPEEVTDDSDLAEIIGLCGSFLTLQERRISLVHQSAKDFLLREVVHEIFPNGADIVHYSIFSKSLGAISRTLQRDIYNLVHPGYPIDQVNQPDPDPLVAIRYACLHWIDHLNCCSPNKNAIEDLQNSGSVGIFFRQNYLHWLEVLSLSRSLSEGVASMLRLESLLKTATEDEQLIDRVQDACRFIRYHKMAIEHYPLQAYASGLIFSPARSITRIQFEPQEPAWIIRKPAMEESWSACLQTLEGHSHWVTSVVFSPDSKLLASASGDHTVKVWDASSGQCLQTLRGHSDFVNTVIFSPDAKLLASASDDGTVKVWDTRSTQCLQTLESHSSSVHSVVFSPDAKKLLASASNDGTVKMWDARSAQCLQTFKGHSHYVNSVIFSPDAKLLVSASFDGTIKVWNTSNGQCLQTLKGHSDKVNLVIFSTNAKLFASASGDCTVKIWDASSGQCFQTLKGHNKWVNSVVFSLDAKLLASASLDRTVRVWDANSGQCLQTLEGHCDYVKSVVFSPDANKLLASASDDGTVKVWDARSGQCLQTLKGHSNNIDSVVFSPDAKLLASASDDGTVKIWDAKSAQCLQTLESHSSGVNSVVFSPDAKKLLASASNDGTVKMWDARSGQCLQTLKGHSDYVKSVFFSPDSKLLASASNDHTIKVWDASSGQCLQTLKGHNKWVNSVVFSPNAKLLASASLDRTVKLWDAKSAQCLQTLESHSSGVNSVVFSPDAKKLLASASNDGTVKMWDARNGQCLQTFKGHSGDVESVVFSPDAKLLASASLDCTIKVWDARSAQCLQTLNVGRATFVKSFDISNSYLETDIGTLCLSTVSDIGGLTNSIDPEVPRVQGYGISSDGTYITWNSENLLWLPSEYRPRTSVLSTSTISLGCGSGRVLFFTFDSQKLPNFLAKR